MLSEHSRPPLHLYKATIMILKPTASNVHITRIAAEKQTSSGIILKSTEEPDKAKVESIGKDVTDLNVGDVVLVNWNKANKVDTESYIIPESEIIMVFE
jgi:co-chaperonin GroES (HSP10)